MIMIVQFWEHIYVFSNNALMWTSLLIIVMKAVSLHNQLLLKIRKVYPLLQRFIGPANEPADACKLSPEIVSYACVNVNRRTRACLSMITDRALALK